LKLQLIPLWPVPKFAHQLPLLSALAAVADRGRATNAIKKNEVVRMVPPRPQATPRSERELTTFDEDPTDTIRLGRAGTSTTGFPLSRE
jgi:hypothetical protein